MVVVVVVVIVVVVVVVVVVAVVVVVVVAVVVVVVVNLVPTKVEGRALMSHRVSRASCSQGLFLVKN